MKDEKNTSNDVSQPNVERLDFSDGGMESPELKGEQDSKKDIDIGIKSMKSKALLSDHMTHSMTGRSYARSSVMFKRITEITDQQKVAKLE